MHVSVLRSCFRALYFADRDALAGLPPIKSKRYQAGYSAVVLVQPQLTLRCLASLQEPGCYVSECFDDSVITLGLRFSLTAVKSFTILLPR